MNRKVVTNMNNYNMGLVCYSTMCVFIILTYTGLYVENYYNPLNEGLVTYKFALEAISFFFSIIFGLVGYFYINGDVDKDFWKIALATIGLLLIMNLGILFPYKIFFIRCINSLI